MPGKGTTRRSVRVPDEVWNSAAARAAAEGRDLSEVIRTMLIEYANPTTPLERQP